MEAAITSGIRYPPLLQGRNSARFLRFNEALSSDSAMLDLRFEVRELPPDQRTPWDDDGTTSDDDITSDGDTTNNDETTSNHSSLDKQTPADASDDVPDIIRGTGECKADYYAISYTWGQSQSLVPIILDGHEVYIRGSAASALNGIIAHIHGSWQHSSTLIWIDAVCIAQADLEEKQRQIGLMGIIFSQASTVFAWLGLDEDSSASEMLEDINLLAKQSDELKEAQSSTKERLEMALPSTFRLTSMHSFLSNPWFSRLWVLQEVCLNPEVVLVQGKVHCEWLAFVKAIGRLRDLALSIPGLSGAMAMTAPQHYGVRPNLCALLALSLYLDVTNPWDKVFAVLGLIRMTKGTDHRSMITLDYGKPLVDVYRDATSLALQDGGLTLLGSGQSNGPVSEEMLSSWSSWVPRYNEALPDPDKSNSLGPPTLEEVNADEGLVPYCAVKDDTVLLRGVLVQTIRAIRLRDLANEDQLELFLRALWKMSREWKPYDLDTLAASLLNGVYEGRLAEGCDDLLQNLGRYMLELKDATLPGNLSLKQSIIQVGGEQGIASQFLSAFKERGRPRHALVELEDGTFARTFNLARPGEHICIIAGLQTPVLLRGVGERRLAMLRGVRPREYIYCFQMRGTVYVPGIWRGEHIERLHDEGRLEDSIVMFPIV